MTPLQADKSVVRKWAKTWKWKSVDLNCAWCKIYGNIICEVCSPKCPLKKINDDCETWGIWSENKTKHNAKIMLDTCIKAIKTVRKYKSFDWIDKIIEEA